MTSAPVRLGAWLMIPDPIVVEAAALAGFDWVGIDLQHGTWDLGLAFRGIQLLDVLGVPSVVRLGRDDLADLPRVCDHGASGVVIAMATEPDLVARAISMARYQPSGERSYGGQRYGMRAAPIDPAEVRPAVYAMIEDRRGLEAVEAIAAVPGLAGLHIGPVDLALGLGLGSDPSGPAYDAALRRIREAARATGISAVLHAVRGHEAEARRSEGFDELVLPADIGLLRGAFSTELAVARGGTVEPYGPYGLRR